MTRAHVALTDRVKRISFTRALTSFTELTMISRDEILKPIWYAFTALDLDRNGKVSKSQLKVSETLIN